MDGLHLELFFRDRTNEDPHTISTWACEFAKSWTLLPPVTQLAIMCFAGAFMRRSTLPCRRTYAMMPTMLQLMEDTSMVHDFSEMEYCYGHAVEWINSLTQNARQLSWPYGYVACLEESASSMTQSRRFSKLFLDYCDDSTNWNPSNQLTFWTIAPAVRPCQQVRDHSRRLLHSWDTCSIQTSDSHQVPIGQWR
jgi:hypothetical protein